MKSNYLKTKAKPVPEPVVPEYKVSQAEVSPKEEEIILTEEEKAAKKELEINRIIEKQVSAQQTYLNLSTDSIY